MRTGTIVGLVALMAAIGLADVTVPDATKVLETLEPGHPRLFLKEADLAALRARAKTDPVLQKCVNDVIRQADRYVGRDPVEYRLIGPRLLQVSRDCLNRVLACSLAYRWTGEEEA